MNRLFYSYEKHEVIDLPKSQRFSRIIFLHYKATRIGRLFGYVDTVVEYWGGGTVWRKRTGKNIFRRADTYMESFLCDIDATREFQGIHA